MNPSKTKFIEFSAKNKPSDIHDINICCDDNFLEEVNETKLLGIVLDKNLNWTSHTDSVCNKVSAGLFALQRLSNILNINTLKCVYFSLIQSHILYGLLLYGSTNSENLNKILILQKRAIRIMLKLKWCESAKEHFSQLGIMTVFSLYIVELVLHVKKT